MRQTILSQELQLQGSHPSAATTFYNWSNGLAGQNINIFTGGAYRLTFTDMYGCRSHNDIGVPLSPQSYFPWFPKGCYSICDNQFPFKLNRPIANFFSWAWNGAPPASGFGVVAPYTITGPGALSLTLNNGLCSATTPNMQITNKKCEDCLFSYGPITAVCDPANPHGYIIYFTLSSPAVEQYELGFDNGPGVPFSFTLPAGTTTVAISYTTLGVNPAATQAEWFIKSKHGGKECIKRKVVLLDPCPLWDDEKPGAGETVTSPSFGDRNALTGMMVYPNPANTQVTVQYNYGNTSTATRSVVIYDMLGREVIKVAVADAQNTEVLSTANLPAGNYLIRMVDNGEPVHTQKLSVLH